jgi:nonribosomal peptide synthetase DhbF
MLPIRPQGKLNPLFCIHPGGGFSWSYSRLIRHVPAGHPIYALQARSLTQPGAFAANVENMAADYLSLIREIQPSGPYNLLGLSFGGLVAHEIATQLQSLGEAVGSLTLLDSYPGKRNGEAQNGDWASEIDSLFASAGDSQIRSQLGSLHREGHIQSSLEEGHIDAIVDLMKRHTALTWNFSPKLFQGDILLFVAADVESPPIEAWKPFVDGHIKVHRIDCTHATMMEPAPVAAIGSILAAELTKSRAPLNPASQEEEHGHQSV